MSAQDLDSYLQLTVDTQWIIGAIIQLPTIYSVSSDRWIYCSIQRHYEFIWTLRSAEFASKPEPDGFRKRHPTYHFCMEQRVVIYDLVSIFNMLISQVTRRVCIFSTARPSDQIVAQICRPSRWHGPMWTFMIFLEAGKVRAT